MSNPGEILLAALTAHNACGWRWAADQWSASIHPEKRMAHALAALAACEADDVATIADEALAGAGSPLPHYLSEIDEASFWADMASVNELKAYAVACHLRLSPIDRRAFFDWAERRAAA